jgi:uncharacterized protein
MSAIRDLITSLRSRAGVDAVVVVGRDGLVIDADAEAGVDTERVAAHVPALVVAGDAFGTASERGVVTTAVVEHERGGLAILAVLTSDVALLVLLDPSADAGPLLYEVRRERARFAALV